MPGNGVSSPSVLREVKPAYTAEAMRAKVQGTVWLQCVVMPDGTVGNVQVTKSLDSTFGLDQEAIKAAKQWRFKPGMRRASRYRCSSPSNSPSPCDKLCRMHKLALIPANGGPGGSRTRLPSLRQPLPGRRPP